MPWDKKRKDAVVGEFARSHGSKVPMRLVASAKSWLCHAGVDRLSAILPWQAPEDVQRVSPLDAAARYLAHLREAWDHQFQDDALAKQDVVLTVPASFDAAARDLTLKAAQQAGLPNITLIEEPQAAFYAWLEQMGEGFRKQVKPGDVVLVVDVGGGTTDFSLIAVTSKDGDVALTRVAVGDHILLGGDNMDLALAHAVNQRLAADGKKLDAWQFNALTFACRQAKEQHVRRCETEEGAARRPGPRFVADRRHHQSRVEPRRTGQRADRWVLSQNPPSPMFRRWRGEPASRKWLCLTRRTPASRAILPRFSRARPARWRPRTTRR